jgi:hypothetical protein
MAFVINWVQFPSFPIFNTFIYILQPNNILKICWLPLLITTLENVYS